MQDICVFFNLDNSAATLLNTLQAWREIPNESLVYLAKLF